MKMEMRMMNDIVEEMLSEMYPDEVFYDQYDPVNQPEHYTSHPSGVECIEICEHMNFLEGNAIKYIWRASLKGKRLEDLRKAQYYVNRMIENEEMDLDE